MMGSARDGAAMSVQLGTLLAREFGSYVPLKRLATAMGLRASPSCRAYIRCAWDAGGAARLALPPVIGKAAVDVALHYWPLGPP